MKKIWFITGASRGLGLAIAKAALEAGNIVVATARNKQKKKNSSAMLRMFMPCRLM